MAFFVSDVAIVHGQECLPIAERTYPWAEFTTLEDGCIIAIHLAIRPNLGLETQPEQLL